MTYKFPQFNVEISNPTIFVNLNTIQDKAIDQLLSVDVVLTTDTATFGVTATDMPYIITWEDDDVEGMVNQWLIQFEV
jgi:endonuclease/exonuclease/phosphatase (EEP) superfamily protein YafD